jgi:AcrR family transcriptional regulator
MRLIQLDLSSAFGRRDRGHQAAQSSADHGHCGHIIETYHTVWYVERVSGRERWLGSGLEALAEEGPDGLKIDRLVRRVGLTKGSFFHHFAGAADYKRVLLNRLEVEATAALDDAAASAPAVATRQLLSELTGRISRPGTGLWRPELEVALRAWSFTDAEVQQTQSRIDRKRLAGLEAIWHRLEPDRQQARIKALLPYLIAVGASMSSVVIDVEELQQVYELLLPLVPS